MKAETAALIKSQAKMKALELVYEKAEHLWEIQQKKLTRVLNFSF